MITLMKENAIRLAICFVFILIFTGGILSYYNRSMMSNALKVKKETEAVLHETGRIHDNIRFMDISARGYALIRKSNFLFWKVEDAQNLNKNIFENLDSLFIIQRFESSGYNKMKKAMFDYTQVFSKMVNHLEQNEMSEYLLMLDYDYGKSFYQTYTPLLDEITSLENELSVKAQEQYEAAVSRNQIVQILLFLFGLPTLLWIFYKLRHDEQDRKKLLLNLETNNRQYLFDDGSPVEKNAKVILQASIQNLKQASDFIGEISTGNYEAHWEGLNTEIENRNKTSLVGRLIYMRDQMKKLKEEDQKRIWTNEGLSELSDIIRKHQHNLQDLYWHALTFLVKYLNAQQGGLFTLRQEKDLGLHLALTACYAYERRKFVEKKVRPGDGLIGQAFLERETILLKQVPEKYISITSGLGYATPKCIVIVPMKHNAGVQAVAEFASFHEYTQHQIAFLEKAGEFVASAIFAAEQNEKNKGVMEKLQTQTEQLRAQEEELRQNIEELEATQETVRRQTSWQPVGD